MSSAPTKPLDVPPYQIEPLISNVTARGTPPEPERQHYSLGSEIYVGCANGELHRYALQADNPNTPESYQLLSRQSVPNDKPIDEVVLVPSINRALILSVDPIDFCVIKRTAIAMYSLGERLTFLRDFPSPSPRVLLAKRSSHYLCIAEADSGEYHVINLDAGTVLPVLPVSQDPSSPIATSPNAATGIKPFIVVVSPGEFLILSWTGGSTLGVFITGEGDPVRGTLQWPDHPLSVSLDYPYITTLLPNGTIEIHNIETQLIAQVVAASDTPRTSLIGSFNGYLVPSRERSDKMKMKKVGLVRGSKVNVAIEENKEGVSSEEEIHEESIPPYDI
ncbi:hypothetical protein JAAARDRAFT_128998 [Jaapia argillacea MUCL 33604]|uniref:CNH domain-containing protein n=1 Tax=Jaapia argillacea MUCL 33604 TaxID=933084 RepID=A0A067Q6V3_9AGAM|nr:hypothetical protein JAAARDRAFT_128998 [Jaapia argillacea MUCL 33604]